MKKLQYFNKCYSTEKRYIDPNKKFYVKFNEEFAKSFNNVTLDKKNNIIDTIKNDKGRKFYVTINNNLTIHYATANNGNLINYEGDIDCFLNKSKKDTVRIDFPYGVRKEYISSIYLTSKKEGHLKELPLDITNKYLSKLCSYSNYIGIIQDNHLDEKPDELGKDEDNLGRYFYILYKQGYYLKRINSFYTMHKLNQLQALEPPMFKFNPYLSEQRLCEDLYYVDEDGNEI